MKFCFCTICIWCTDCAGFELRSWWWRTLNAISNQSRKEKNFSLRCDNAWRVMKKNASRPFNMLDVEASWKRFCIFFCTRSKRKPLTTWTWAIAWHIYQRTEKQIGGSTVRWFQLYKIFFSLKQEHFFNENNGIFTVENEWNRTQTIVICGHKTFEWKGLTFQICKRIDNILA